MPSQAPCRPPARRVAHRIAHALRCAPSLYCSSRLTALVRRVPPCVAVCSSLLGVSMRLVEFVEEDVVGNPHIECALVVV